MVCLDDCPKCGTVRKKYQPYQVPGVEKEIKVPLTYDRTINIMVALFQCPRCGRQWIEEVKE